MSEQLGLNFNFEYNKDRDITLLMGICSGIAADGFLTDGEIHFLRAWLREHRNIADRWPAAQIIARLDLVLADGIIAKTERDDLLQLIAMASRTEFADTGCPEISDPTNSLIDDFLGEIIFSGSFCFTGNFAYGTRDVCHFVSRRVGAEIHRDVTQKTDYVVVGQGANPDWKHGAFGTKIDKAMRFAKKFDSPKFIHEKTWIKHIEEKAKKLGIPELRAGFRNPKRRASSIDFSDAGNGVKYASGWFFKVPDVFRSALDICYIESDKKAQWQEGDPPIYRFCSHDQFTSADGERYILHITESVEDKIGDLGEIIRGSVSYRLYERADQTYEQRKCATVSNIELVRILISGLL